MSSVIDCQAGVFDCEYADAGDDVECANYNGEYLNMKGNVWIVVASAIVLCATSFGIGANDVANAWGTSVGSGALPLRAAVALAAVGDFLGAVTLGHGVSDTIAKGVSDVNNADCWACGYCDSKMSLYQVGMFSALVGAAFLLLSASYFSMPVSGTHAVVGGVVGMTLLSVGNGCIDWSVNGLSAILVSWVVSPVLSGVIGAGIYLLSERLVFKARSPRDRALMLLPWFFSTIAWVMVYLIFLKSTVTKKMPSWVHFLAATVGGVTVLACSIVLAKPFIVKQFPSGFSYQSASLDNSSVSDEENNRNNSNNSRGMLYSTVAYSDENAASGSVSEGDHSAKDGYSFNMDNLRFKESISLRGSAESADSGVDSEIADAMYCFKYLLVFNAFLESFSHGANDTANSTAPFSVIFSVYFHGEDACQRIAVNEWTMILGGTFVALGVITYGEKVIKTVGEGLTKIDFHKGFCIEFSSCVTVVIATVLGLPVSTTHCQIGSVVFVGLVSVGPEQVSWGIVGKILVAWLVTVPVAGIISVAMTSLLEFGL